MQSPILHSFTAGPWKTADFCFHLAELCVHFPTYQCKTRALTCLKLFLDQQHLPLSARHTIQVSSSSDAAAIRLRAKRIVTANGTHRPNWTNYVLERINVVGIPMSTWSLKFVNIQRTAKNHVWGLPTMAESMKESMAGTAATDDLIRIPANSKSRFSLEEQHAEPDQRKHCNSFLGSIGINRDLIRHPSPFKPADLEEPYKPPEHQQPFIVQGPEDLAADLYWRTAYSDNIHTVEDKDPGVLWCMKTRVFLRHGTILWLLVRAAGKSKQLATKLYY